MADPPAAPAAGAPSPARLVWRLTAPRYAERAYTGEGARLYGGRWNHPGTPIVYTSDTLSLAALEYFIHLEPDIAPEHLASRAAGIPVDLRIPLLSLADLPAGWRTFPAPERLKDLGTGWARSRVSLALSVPSTVIPHERNVLLNPLHPDFGKIRLLPPEDFSFDPRMWKR
jgi:RES domain-containing protein